MSDQDIELNAETGEEIIGGTQETEEVENQTENQLGDGHDDSLSEDTDDDDDDSSTTGSANDDDREAIRERRKQERQRRKQAQREREDTLRRELASRDAVINELRSKVDLIERRNTGSEVAQIAAAKKQTAQAYKFFKDQIRIATEQNNGAAVADATENLLKTQRRFDELDRLEKAHKRQATAPQAIDPRLVNHAKAWMAKNPWYDPAAGDIDSEIAMRIDQRMSQEGWDPTTQEYWQELDSRVKKHLPHRANSGKIKDTRPSKSVVAGGGREATNGSSKEGATYKLSSERVKALKDAGLWDDPKTRAEAVKRFREYDKQHKA